MKIRLENICKYYGQVKANHNISFTIYPNSIHAILGENGAGKSTLMKILAGFIPKTKGKIFIDDQEVEYNTPAQASQLGIGMLYQDPQDFAGLTVLENFMLGLDISWRLNFKLSLQQFLSYCSKLGFYLLPNSYLSELSIGERQQLELIRLLALGVKVLILDEPTTGISEEQKRILFQALKQLAKEGKSILLVSHKLEDVENLCDRVTVLRNGQVSGEMKAPLATEKLLAMMFGQKIKSRPGQKSFPVANPSIEIKNLTARQNRISLKNCNLSIRPGEIIGLAGLEKSGQELFLKVVAGLISPQTGSIKIQGREFAGQSQKVFFQNHIHFVPTDRLERGLFSDLTILEHYMLVFQTAHFFLQPQKAYSFCLKKITSLKIKGNPQSLAKSLSGGNQQRLLLSLLPNKATLLALEQPTRGLDIESSLWVWEYLQTFCKQGSAILFSSGEIEEIFQVAHRVLVFYDGQILLNKQITQTTPEEVSKAITGKVSYA